MLVVLHSLRHSTLLPRSIRIRNLRLLSSLASRPFSTSTTALDIVYRRYGSTDAPSRQNPPPTLLPDPVSGWPTPWITAEDIERYMCVLNENGWDIRFSAAHSKPTKSHPSRVVPELFKTYHFANVEFAAKFAEDVKELMTEENHHCVLHVADTQLTIYTHTHSARPALGSKNAPGITLRDVRFAMLVDLLHANGANDTGDS
ncbi:hypothetical protein EYR38_006460 [Pleurotus pulmonarius]|nr:hypothetical protein EYR38_006460 [Pleurotus pulmonarius]